eukprot:c30484_g1_i1.p1 GENE.c30484_g1_i1~~c30484_g1_i1.p1  ORF type:complete len:105 (-),score=1.18 c30484_g1_i1:23-295(-)
MDNAKIHRHQSIMPIILDLLDDLQIRVLFQPCYSPEFNSCEMVFGYTKRKLRTRRVEGVPFWQQVKVILASISHSMMRNWYRKAILGIVP